MSISRGSGVGRDLLGGRDQLIGRAGHGPRGLATTRPLPELTAWATIRRAARLDPLRVGDGRAAELHDYGRLERHCSDRRVRAGATRRLVGPTNHLDAFPTSLGFSGVAPRQIRAAARERPAERHFVRVLEVRADRQAARQPRDRHLRRHHPDTRGDVQGGRLAGGGRVRRDHHLAHGAAPQPVVYSSVIFRSSSSILRRSAQSAPPEHVVAARRTRGCARSRSRRTAPRQRRSAQGPGARPSRYGSAAHRQG